MMADEVCRVRKKHIQKIYMFQIGVHISTLVTLMTITDTHIIVKFLLKSKNTGMTQTFKVSLHPCVGSLYYKIDHKGLHC
jgi:hypothetical protein